MGMRHQKRRVGHQAADKIAMARMLIEEADRRWHGGFSGTHRHGSQCRAGPSTGAPGGSTGEAGTVYCRG
jgi:hypothetical protein